MKKRLISYVLSSCLYEALCAKENGEQIVARENATNLGYPVELFEVNILVWVSNVVPTSVKLLRIFEVTISDTWLWLSQYMGILNSIFSLEIVSICRRF